MTDEPPHLCEGMASWLDEVDIPVRYGDVYREYGIDVLDGGSSQIHISFCPYCGVKLPDSLRDEWFARLEEMEIDPVDDEGDIPLDMRTGAWWRRPRDPNAGP